MFGFTRKVRVMSVTPYGAHVPMSGKVTPTRAAQLLAEWLPLTDSRYGMYVTGDDTIYFGTRPTTRYGI